MVVQDPKPEFSSLEAHMKWGFAELEKNEGFRLDRDLFIGETEAEDGDE